ncbi:hypothetical protein D558_1014 [Bordetella holmesii 44057]|nr:hypothetical protein D558_1014 [Bordetella holmesii 44057]EWM46264.1 hypothetical protein D555_1037 [Bordetella holmesii 35009]
MLKGKHRSWKLGRVGRAARQRGKPGILTGLGAGVGRQRFAGRRRVRDRGRVWLE